MIKLRVEIAKTDEEKSTGLMYRKHLDKDSGMLFLFNKPGYYKFHMANTYIPLSIAFINKDFRIVDIKDMAPEERQMVGSKEPFVFAIEANKGWFLQNKIRVGDKVNLNNNIITFDGLFKDFSNLR